MIICYVHFFFLTYGHLPNTPALFFGLLFFMLGCFEFSITTVDFSNTKCILWTVSVKGSVVFCVFTLSQFVSHHQGSSFWFISCNWYREGLICCFWPQTKIGSLEWRLRILLLRSTPQERTGGCPFGLGYGKALWVSLFWCHHPRKCSLSSDIFTRGHELHSLVPLCRLMLETYKAGFSEH